MIYHLPKDHKSNWKYILIFAILAAIAGGGILGYLYFWWPKQLAPVPEFPEIKKPEKVEDETANWKTYRNEGYGFEIKYPEEWKVNFETPNVEIASVGRDQYLHGVGTPQKGNAWIILLPSLPENFSESEEEIGVGPGDFVIVLNKAILTINNKRIGVIKGYWKDDPLISEFEQVFNQMLFTFKFIEATEKFCGSSTYGSCLSDADCQTGGCSGQVCQSKNEESVITTCEMKDCYVARKYNLDCKCIDNKCQWSK